MIGFVTTRFLLERIGFVDYGILTALGATGLLTTVLTSGLSNAAQRHITFEIGAGNMHAAKGVYSSALLIFGLLTLLVFVLGVVLKPLVFMVLSTPDDRISAAETVYWCVVIQWGLATFAAPSRALLYAHQHIVVASLFGIAQKVLQLGVVLALYFLSGDSLALYAILFTLALLLVTVFLIAYTLSRYVEVRPVARLANRKDSRRILNFGGWSLLSILVFQLRQQGAIFAINVAFGPTVNAAYAIATSINAHLHQASNAIHTAVQPAMTTAYAQESKAAFGSLLSAGSRYTYFISLFLFIPLFIETQYFMEFWLGKYPAGSIEFARLVALASVLGYLVNGYGLALPAMDKMKEMVAVTATVQLVSFAAGLALVFLFDLSASALPVSIIFGALVLWLIVPWHFGKSVMFTHRQWLAQVLLPCAVVTLPAFLCGFAMHYLFPEGLFRLLLVVVTVAISLIVAIYAFGATEAEKRAVLDYLRARVE